jgi:hypothetical protein
MTQMTDEEAHHAHQTVIDVINTFPDKCADTVISLDGFCLYLMSHLTYRLALCGTEPERIADAIALGIAMAEHNTGKNESRH